METAMDTASSWTTDLASTTSYYYQWMISYGMLQVLGLAALAAITIFRREMSCNHCYAEEPEDVNTATEGSTVGGTLDNDEYYWDEEGTEDILDGAGLYCSGASLVPVVLSLIKAFSSGSEDAKNEAVRKIGYMLNSLSTEEALDEEALDRASSFYSLASLLLAKRTPPPTSLPRAITIANSAAASEEQSALCHELSPDVQVNILAFLHPRDVAGFACVCKASRRIVDTGETSQALWKALWRRDYAWIVESCTFGKQAAARSAGAGGAAQTIASLHFDKDFYFRFGLGYLNYVLAGNDSTETCLVGLHGHIYDMTSFILSHPGTPETVMVQAGRDATQFFDSVRHSAGALRLGRSMCVVVDMSRIDGEACGVRPTSHTKGESLPLAVDQPDPQTTPNRTQSASLASIRATFLRQEQQAQERANRQVLDPLLIGDVNVYYDPFHGDFRAWYLNTNLETTFVTLVL